MIIPIIMEFYGGERELRLMEHLFNASQSTVSSRLAVRKLRPTGAG